jgi:small conductance mechanosensitive channel
MYICTLTLLKIKAMLLQIPTIFHQDSLMVSSDDHSISGLIKQGRFEELLDKLIHWSIDFGGKLLLAILIFVIGKWLIKRIKKTVNRIMAKRNLDRTLQGFLKNLMDIFLYTVLIIFIINLIGTKTVSIAAIIAAAGLAIGLAVKDNLANFAGGVMLLFNRPFNAGDLIEAQNLKGTVQTIGILYTQLVTFDSRRVYIPNGPLSTGNIINYSSEPNRRLEFVIGVDYGTNVDEVKGILSEIMDNHPKILKDPAPVVILREMKDSSVEYALRFFTKNEDYSEVNFNMNELVYNKLNEKGISIPFPQLTLHLASDSDKSFFK